jgi:hypothetical protein
MGLLGSFMFWCSYLDAFCSSQCRDDQISSDRFDKLVDAEFEELKARKKGLPPQVQSVRGGNIKV